MSPPLPYTKWIKKVLQMKMPNPIHTDSLKCQCQPWHDGKCIRCGKPIDTHLDLLAMKLAVRLNELRDKRPAGPPYAWAMDRHLGRMDELTNVIRTINELRGKPI